MTTHDVTRASWHEAREVLNNPKLRLKDILEWSTGPIVEIDGETAIKLPTLGVWVAVPKAADRRGRQTGPRLPI